MRRWWRWPDGSPGRPYLARGTVPRPGAPLGASHTNAAASGPPVTIPMAGSGRLTIWCYCGHEAPPTDWIWEPVPVYEVDLTAEHSPRGAAPAPVTRTRWTPDVGRVGLAGGTVYFRATPDRYRRGSPDRRVNRQLGGGGVMGGVRSNRSSASGCSPGAPHGVLAVTDSMPWRSGRQIPRFGGYQHGGQGGEPYAARRCTAPRIDRALQRVANPLGDSNPCRTRAGASWMPRPIRRTAQRL
jgi:hypothetical protein